MSYTPDYTADYTSWGNFPHAQHKVRRLTWPSDAPEALQGPATGSLLAYAYGRSYGDSCLNDGGTLLDVRALDRLIAFDAETGVLRAEAGISLAQVLEFAVPRGWFLPVSPGTRYVSLAGAVANDVHGKNHHRAGTFGRHVLAFELLRSDGASLVCSPHENADLFRATVGGLGLTGLIVWVEVALKAIQTTDFEVESVKFANLDEFFALSAESDASHAYTVAWVDCAASGSKLGRGLYMRGNHAAEGDLRVHPQARLSVPVSAPNALLNPLSVRAFNTLYFHKQRARVVRAQQHYTGFFYPLDAVHQWNKIYGTRGFLQYQFVLPYAGDASATKAIFRAISASGMGSFLAVLKMFGDLPSPGMLSFPRQGVTLALDFPNQGARTFDLLTQLDEVVRAEGGRLYPAKDARMSAQNFRHFYPQWREFAAYVDPRFSSSFWRRVTQDQEDQDQEDRRVQTEREAAA